MKGKKVSKLQWCRLSSNGFVDVENPPILSLSLIIIL